MNWIVKSRARAAAPLLVATIAAGAALGTGILNAGDGTSFATPSPHASEGQHFNPVLPPVGPGRVHAYTITLRDVTLGIATGVRYNAWTFDGTVPGRVIHVRQGDTVKVTLKNDGRIAHSIDFHAARIPPNEAFRSVDPGKSISFSFVARDAGVFMYHCGTPPVLAHIANGMYGAIVVDPATPLPPADRSYVLVSGEWYLNGDGRSSPAGLDFLKARRTQPDYVAFNGVANQYKDAPLTAKPNERVRFYVVDAGPSLHTDFHVVGTIFNRIYPSGRASEVLHAVQTYSVPAGGGAVFDVRIAKKGVYPVVSHSFASVDMGELALLNVGASDGAAGH